MSARAVMSTTQRRRTRRDCVRGIAKTTMVVRCVAHTTRCFMISRPLLRAPNPTISIGQIGGHVKRGFKHPRGQRTGKSMALISALPLAEDSDLMVLAFMDRSDPY